MVIIRLISTAFMYKKLSESTKLFLFRKVTLTSETIYALLVIFRLTSTAFMDKKKSESTTLSLFRKEKVNDRHIEDNTILWGE